jgi:WD40 repeat protein
MSQGYQTSAVGNIIFSPDGKCIILCDDAGDVKIWDTTTGEMLTSIHAHPDFVTSVAVNSDGSQIASAGATDKTIKVWDAQTGTQLASFHGGQEQVSDSLAFSPDGKYIVSGWGSHIKIWEIETGSELRTLHGHEGWLTSLAFTRDGKRIISSSWDGTAKLWDVSRDHEAIRLMANQGPLDSISIAFSPDSKRIASNTDGMTKVWDANACVELMTLHGPVTGFQGKVSIVFSPDGGLIGATIPGGMIKVWNAETSAEVITLRAPGQQVWDLAFSPDNKRIAGASVTLDQARGVIKIWDISNGKEIMALPLEEFLMPFSVAFSPDGKYLSSGLYVVPNRQGGFVKERGAVKVWDASSGTEVRTMTSEDGPVLCVEFSPDGKLIASGNHIVTAKVWDVATGAELVTLNGHDGAVCSIAFSPDGRRIITGCDDKTARVWDVATGAELLSLTCNSEVHCATFNANGSVVAAGAVDGTVFLWDSNIPVGAFEVRNTGKAATKRVDELQQKLGFYHDVIADLHLDLTLDSAVRRLALQIANSRKWEDVDKLNKESWEMVSSPDKDIDAYKSASEKAEKANSWEPNDPAILNTLGAAQYRLGSYEDAIKTLTRSERILSDAGEEAEPVNMAFTAMTLHRIGRLEEAKAALEKLRELSKDEQFAEDMEVQGLLAEAEKLITGEKK